MVVSGRILRWLPRFLPLGVYVLNNPLPLCVRGILEYDGIVIPMIRLCYTAQFTLKREIIFGGPDLIR